MNSFVNHKLASGREHFLTNITLCSVPPIAGLGCTLPQMSCGDLVAAEQFATTRAGELLPRLDAGVGSLVEPECVRPACGEGAVFKGALVSGRAGVNSLVPPEIAGGGEQPPTAGTRVVLRLGVVQLVLVEIVLVAGLVTTAGGTATKHSLFYVLCCCLH